MKGINMFEKPKKKKVNWHGQTVVLPFNCSVYLDKEVEIANRFTGEKTKMPGYAARTEIHTNKNSMTQTKKHLDFLVVVEMKSLTQEIGTMIMSWI